jgi:23S rRNA (guanosine2251-2'-O)-methyltransferase
MSKPRSRGPRKKSRKPATADSKRPRGELLYGRQGVRESLRAGRRHFHELYLARGLKQNDVVQEIVSLAKGKKLPVQQVEREQLDAWLDGTNHQGVMLRAGVYPYTGPSAMLARAQKRDESPFLLLLDRVQDPQNLGSLFRAAEAFGVHGVILPKHRAAHITPAVVNASAGAVEHLLVATATNLVVEMKALKEDGLWIAGLEARPDAVDLHQVDLRGPLAVVVGSEGFGLSRLVAETCDWLVKLPMRGHINSLNAAVAGSVFLFWAMQQREVRA